MITVIIEGQQACLQEGTTFDYVSESRLFADSDGYTFNMTFPLRGCQQNIDIFGYIHRDDIHKPARIMKCHIIAPNFHRTGAIVITSVTETEVTAQFIANATTEGTESPLDTLYIDELDLGRYPETDPSRIKPSQAINGSSDSGPLDAVCLPWRTEQYDVVNNRFVDMATWHEETRRLSWQPKLYYILRRVAMQAGYSTDFRLIEVIPKWRQAIVCNTLPGVWGITDYAAALPHWTVREFFEQMGLYMQGVFKIDEQAKSITFDSYTHILSGAGVTVLDKVVDQYTSDVDKDAEDGDFLPTKRVKYPDSSQTIWKYWFCPWVLDSKSPVWAPGRVETVEQLTSNMQYGDRNSNFVGGGSGNLVYCAEIDTWFSPRTVIIYSAGHTDEATSQQYQYAKFVQWEPVNIFAPKNYDKKDNYTTLQVCPATIDFDLTGKVIWLPLSGESGSTSGTLDMDYFDTTERPKGLRLPNGVWLSSEIVVSYDRAQHDIENHSEDNSSEFYSQIFVAFQNPEVDKRPWPLVDVDVAGEIYSTERFCRLDGQLSDYIDPKVKYTFQFLADSIPDVESLFYIHGQPYICRKITVTLSVTTGLQKLMTGEFYRIVNHN